MRALSHQFHWLVIAAMLLGPASSLAQDLDVTSSVSNQFPAMSEPVELTVVVSNPNSVTVSGIVVSNSLPDGLVVPSINSRSERGQQSRRVVDNVE